MQFEKCFLARVLAAVIVASTIGLAQCSSELTLFTTNVGGNGQNGVMFDLVNLSATDTMTITGFDVNLDPGTWPVQTWYVTAGGTHTTVASTAAAWTLASSGTVTSLGTSTTGASNILTPYPAISRTIAPGATQGFAVNIGSSSTTLNYTTGTAGTQNVGQTLTQDANLRVIIGFGKAWSATALGPFGGNLGSTTAGGRLANIRVHYTSTGSTPPVGTGTASPSAALAGAPVTLTVNACPGANPASTGITVVADTTSLGGGPLQPMTEGPAGVFTLIAAIPPATPPSVLSVPFTVSDAQARSSNGAITIGVLAPNDSCGSPIAVTDGLVVGNNTTATTDAPTSTCAAHGRDIWYTYTNPATCPRTVTLSLCATEGGAAGFDTLVTVYSGTCGAFTEVACNDDTCSVQSKVTFTANPLTTYTFFVGSWSTSIGGPFTLAISHHDAASQQFGTSCGTVPPTLNGGLPLLGQPGTLTITGADPNASGILLVSPPGGTPQPLFGACTLYLQQGGMLIFLTLTTDGAGAWSFTSTIPNDPALDCFPVDLQALLAGVNGFALTNGLHLVLGH